MHLEGASVRGVPDLSSVPAVGDALDRYDAPIELHPECSHGAVLELVGAGNRVADLGCAAGRLARAMTEAGNTVVGVDVESAYGPRAAAACERFVVADLDAGWPAELEAEQFDVIVVADVLEHLRDPARLLRELPARLTPGGYVVASLPNVAHASVRLALLEGRFPYSETGLLDRTHLRFYSRESLRRLFADAGLAVTLLRPVTKALADSEVPFELGDVPPDVLARLAADPDAETYQFIVVAHAVPAHAPPDLAHRVHEMLDVMEAARATADAERGRAEAERGRAGALEHRLADREREIDELQEGVAALQRRLAVLGADHAELRTVAREAYARSAADEERERDRDRTRRAEIAALQQRAAERDAYAVEVTRMRSTRAWRAACAWWRLGELMARRG
jgi:2-polyprenyl-3-methyl-5-hydroxy-6-metoxy-1,4-benzoquinol methylase